MKNSFLIFIFLLAVGLSANAQLPTANSFSSYIPYSGKYSYGANLGYYGGNWSAENMAALAIGSTSPAVKGAGVKSLRVPLYDDHLTNWGLNAELSKIQYYTSLGAGELTAFVGSPHSSKRETMTFPESPEPAKTFKNMYEPIWLDAAQTQINPNNLYAKYLYDVVNTYGAYIKFWEIVNEPDFTWSSSGWMGDMNPPWAGSWYDHDPTPEELVNLRAPIEYYVRMLRISWEVIKKLQPNDYVCTGGIGYRAFLDAVLRNTDNPADGSVTSQYPLKGGAYFDVLSFHCYPMYNLPKTWNNVTGAVDVFRHSDEALMAYINVKNDMQAVLNNYGYNNSQYPRKQYICTETGVSRVMGINGEWGSNEGQKNYMIKAHIGAQKNGINQVYWFQLGDGGNPAEQFDRMGLYYYFAPNYPFNASKSDQGIAMKTTSDILFNRTYDAAKTSVLNLPSTIDGGAFRGVDGSYVYVLWAKTRFDLSESASATYSFPATAFAAANVVRREWNFSENNTSTTISRSNIPLNGTPSFFTEGTGTTVPTNQNPVANAGTDQTITLPANSVTLTGTGSDADGNVTAYSWTKISGPASGGILSPSNAQTVVNNLTQGVYLFELKVTDNVNATGRDTVQVTVNTAQTAGSFRVEAENFTAQNGVQTETTGDAIGGGQNVGWIDPNDWMDYSINPATAGTYTVSFRVATPNNGSQFQLRKSDGSVLATITAPNTGGYQAYQNVTASVTLSAGLQTVRIFSTATPRWNFNWMEFSPSSGAAAAPPPAPGTATKIEAEAFSSQSGVQTEWTQDAGGGQNVGWIDNGDWMDYSYNAPSTGTYTVKFRIATPNSGAQLQIRKSDGTVLSTVNITNTGAYQIWQTITATVNLTQGQQTLRILSPTSQGWNFNWMEITPGGTSTPPPATSTTFKVEAESFTAQQGVQTETTGDIAGGGQNVGWIDQGDWMDYSINPATAGTYTVKMRLATPNNGAQLQIKKADGSVLTTVNIPNTGGFQGYQTVEATLTLAEGQQTVRVQSSAAALWNFNWMEFSTSSATTPTVPVTAKVEAENWTRMSGVQTENTWDAGGGQNVGWIDQGDWMEYSVTTANAGNHTINFRVATTNNNGQLQVKKADGTVIGTLTIPNTGSYQGFQTVAATVALQSGTQTIRIESSAAPIWNINWFEIVQPGSGTVRTATVDSAEIVTPSLEISPNPVTDRFVIKVNNQETGLMKVFIINAKNETVRTFSFAKPAEGVLQTYLSIANLQAGDYTLKVEMNGWTQTTRLTKQ
jgi:hypothetical protein